MSDRPAFSILPTVFKLLFSVLTFSCRTHWHGKEHLDTLKKAQQAWIYSTWHNNVATGSWTIRGQNIGIMISDSKDGEFITRCVERFGNYGIRGSSSSGSTKATRGALKAIRQGNSIAVTPDGPRGPKYELQSGVLWLAALSKAPIIPFHIECNRQWVFEKSWDKHKLPKPFSHIHVCVGEPIQITKEQLQDNEADVIHQVQQAMMENVISAEQKASR